VAQHHGSHFTGTATGTRRTAHAHAHIAHGQFNLRALFLGVHGRDQGTQRHQHGAHVGGQHGTYFHVGHVTAFALVKTHQHFALFAHKTHRQAGAVAVAPGGAFDGAQHVVGAHLADVPQVVFQHTLLYCHLGRRVQVLHLAATARTLVQAKVRAARAHALRRFLVNNGQRAFLKTGFAAVNLGTDHFKGQGTINKNDFAIGLVGDTLGFQVQGFHTQPALGQGFISQIRIGHA
jgi:hypothetical protein